MHIRSHCESLETRRLLSAGGLDRSFGDGGFVIKDIAGADESLSNLLPLANQQMLAVVQITPDSGLPYAQLLRFNADGTLDRSFGKHGIATFTSKNVDIQLAAAALSPNGKVLLLLDEDITRLDVDGTLDTTFGDKGFIHDPDLNSSDTRIAVAPDNSFYLIKSPNEMPVVRHFTVNGNADTEFDSNPTTALPASEFFGALTITSGGNAIVATSDNNKHAILREFLPDGNLNSTFGSAGKVILNVASSATVAKLLTVMPDGRIVLFNSQPDNSTDPSQIIRLTAEGKPDNSFGTAGFASVNFAADEMAIAPGGSILLAAAPEEIVPTSGDGSVSNDLVEVERLVPSGSLDQSFGDQGIFTRDFRGTGAAVQGLFVQPDGRIVFGGNRTSVDPSAGLQLFVGRLLPDNSTPVGGVRPNEPIYLDQGMDLHLRGTDFADEMYVRLSSGNRSEIIATVNEESRVFSRKEIRRIIIEGGADDDIIRIAAGLSIPCSIDGDAGDDSILGGAGNDTIDGGPGFDIIGGRAGADLLLGGSGNDALFGDGGNDRLHGGNGADLLDGGAGNDRLFANDGVADTLYGEGGSDSAQVDSLDTQFSVEN